MIAIPSALPPLTLRVSVTDRCQCRCLYCLPAEGITLRSCEDILSFEQIVDVVRHLQGLYDVRKVRLTGGDPLVRKGLPELVRMLSDLGIADLALTTNGQQLSGLAVALKDAGLHRINISLDSLCPSTFSRITRGNTLQMTLDGIEAAARAGLLPIKLNMVVMRGINDAEIEAVLDYALRHGHELRFLELMPIGTGAALFHDAFMSAKQVRERLAAQFELTPLPHECGSSGKRFHVRATNGTTGVAGFISPCSDPFCQGCTRLRLTSDGHVIGCLAREDGFDIRSYLKPGDEAGFGSIVRRALGGKRLDHDFEQSTAMAAIGG